MTFFVVQSIKIFCQNAFLFSVGSGHVFSRMACSLGLKSPRTQPTPPTVISSF